MITENLELKGYNIPKGVNAVTINQIACQFEEHFPLPLEFRPERWIRGDSLYRQNHPYLVLPFGHGPRACIARRFAEQNILTVMLKVHTLDLSDWILVLIIFIAAIEKF